MTTLQIASLLSVFAGALGAINYLFFKLPSAIGILVVAFLASLGVLAIDWFVPSLGVAGQVRGFVAELEFSETLLGWMLGRLLFAGALHVRIEDLKAQAWTIGLMATLGEGLSTAVVGVGL